MPEDFEFEWTICPACEGTNYEDSAMGSLGDLAYFRCRFCGMIYSSKDQEAHDGHEV